MDESLVHSGPLPDNHAEERSGVLFCRLGAFVFIWVPNSQQIEMRETADEEDRAYGHLLGHLTAAHGERVGLPLLSFEPESFRNWCQAILKKMAVAPVITEPQSPADLPEILKPTPAVDRGRYFLLSEDDLIDFARQSQAAAMTTLVTLYHFSVDSQGAELLGQGLADMLQQQEGWLRDRLVGAGAELLPDAEERVTPAIRKVAVDTLYAAREGHKVMDQAALFVAAAVLKEAGAEDLLMATVEWCDSNEGNIAVYYEKRNEGGSWSVAITFGREAPDSMMAAGQALGSADTFSEALKQAADEAGIKVGDS